MCGVSDSTRRTVVRAPARRHDHCTDATAARLLHNHSPATTRPARSRHSRRVTFSTADAALARIGPIARTAQLRAAGITAREISRAAREGRIRSVRRGVYATADTDQDFLHAAVHGGAPACTVAGRLHGLWMLRADALHVWLGGAGHHAQIDDACVIHWDAGVVELGRLPPVANVLLQIAHCAGEEVFFAALESALRQNLFPPGRVNWLRRRLPPELKWLIAFARSDADSGLESLVRLRLHKLGITVRTQVLIDDVGEADILIGDRLIIETDGRDNHDGRSFRHKDLRRDAAAAQRGYETLRFDYALIVHDWPRVEAAILSKIKAGAHLRREG